MKTMKNEIKNYLFERGCEETYFHCEAVGDYAAKMAKNYSVDPEKARLAGYLHDISAVYPNDQKVEVAKQFGLMVFPEELELPMITHQRLSRQVALRDFNVLDEEILSAIECHTTLKAGYSQMDLVLFVADKIECDCEGEPPYLNELLKELDTSLEAAAYYYIDYLLGHDILVVHPWLKEAYAELGEKLSVS